MYLFPNKNMSSVIQPTHKLNHPEILSDVIHKIPRHKEDSEWQWIFLGTNLPITKVWWWTLSSPGAHGLWLRTFFFLSLQTPLPISLIGCLYFLGQALRMQNLFVLSLFGRLIALCRIFRAFSVWLPDCFWKSGDTHRKTLFGPGWWEDLVRPVVDVADLPCGFSKQRMCICICKKKETRKTYQRWPNWYKMDDNLLDNCPVIFIKWDIFFCSGWKWYNRDIHVP